MELVNFFRSYPVWAQVIFIACIVVQLCLALLAPREARKVGEQSTNAPAPLSGPQQSASGTGNIQIARATNVHIASAPKERQSPHAEKMASFIVEAQKLRDRLGETPLPVRDHNEWVERVNQYLKANLGVAYEVRFNDFSGMTFYGNGTDRSAMSRSLEGRSRRLHEFISETTK
jgi:hypothetical protein